MMTTLRTQMKLILWILVFAFLATIIFSWGMGGFKNRGAKPGVLGEIDNYKITVEGFEDVVRRKQEAAARQGEENRDNESTTKMREDTWDEQVEALLKREVAHRLGLHATNRQIAYVVENNPPTEVQQAEIFQTDGKFDIQKYQQFLRDPSAEQFLIGMEQSVRNFLLEQALTFEVMQSVTVTEQEVMDEYLNKTARGKLRFIFVPFSDFPVDSGAVTEEMMVHYYRMFPDRFKDYGQRKFAYVKFPLKATELDSQDVLSEAEYLLQELRDGADFAELARENSDDPGSAADSGSLGWFGHGAMVKPFEDAAFAAQPGNLIGPVLSRFGYHIILVEDKRVKDGAEEVKARHILLKVEPSADTRDEVYGLAYDFAQRIKEADFSGVAKELDLQVDTTDYFSESGYIARLGRMRMAAKFCFNNPVGTVSDVYPVPDGYVVFQIVGATEDRMKPFEDVKKTISKRLAKVLQRQRTWEKAASIRGDIAGPEDLEKAAAAAGYTIHVSADSMRPTDPLPDGLKKDADFLKEAFRLEKGAVSEVIEGRNGCYIAHMEDKTPFSREDYLTQHAMIYKSLAGRVQSSAVRNWMRELRIAADIKDYRYKYYRDF